MTDGTTPKPAHKRPIPPWRPIAAAAALACLLLAAAAPALANSYSRGNWSCEDFRDAERDYRSDPENIYSQRGYARCLITRGDETREDTLRGLNILHDIVDYSTHPGRVGAAWMLANYIKTGGTFEDTTDEDNINEAIEAYKKVRSFIKSDPDYPHKNELYEEAAQIELKTHYRIPLLYFEKFKKGAQGSHNAYKQISISYEGNGGLNTYPEYSPYTLDSLEKTIEFADICLALPDKWHFRPATYAATKEECQVLKEASQALLPLERKRLALLDKEFCSNALIQCEEYNEIFKDEMIPIVRQARSDIVEIIQKYASPK